MPLTFDQILKQARKAEEAAQPKSPVKSNDYHTLATTIAQEVGLDPDLFKRLIRQESGFNPSAKSPVGAIGLTQLMPATAKGLKVNPYDPVDNLRGGARYLKQQIDHFGGDITKAVAAYNAGPGAVEKYGGVPPYKETQNYVKSILGAAPQPKAYQLKAKQKGIIQTGGKLPNILPEEDNYPSAYERYTYGDYVDPNKPGGIVDQSIQDGQDFATQTQKALKAAIPATPKIPEIKPTSTFNNILKAAREAGRQEAPKPVEVKKPESNPLQAVGDEIQRAGSGFISHLTNYAINPKTKEDSAAYELGGFAGDTLGAIGAGALGTIAAANPLGGLAAVATYGGIRGATEDLKRQNKEGKRDLGRALVSGAIQGGLNLIPAAKGGTVLGNLARNVGRQAGAGAVGSVLQQELEGGALQGKLSPLDWGRVKDDAALAGAFGLADHVGLRLEQRANAKEMARLQAESDAKTALRRAQGNPEVNKKIRALNLDFKERVNKKLDENAPSIILPKDTTTLEAAGKLLNTEAPRIEQTQNGIELALKGNKPQPRPILDPQGSPVKPVEGLNLGQGQKAILDPQGRPLVADHNLENGIAKGSREPLDLNIRQNDINPPQLLDKSGLPLDLNAKDKLLEQGTQSSRTIDEGLNLVNSPVKPEITPPEGVAKPTPSERVHVTPGGSEVYHEPTKAPDIPRMVEKFNTDTRQIATIQEAFKVLEEKNKIGILSDERLNSEKDFLKLFVESGRTGQPFYTERREIKEGMGALSAQQGKAEVKKRDSLAPFAVSVLSRKPSTEVNNLNKQLGSIEQVQQQLRGIAQKYGITPTMAGKTKRANAVKIAEQIAAHPQGQYEFKDVYLNLHNYKSGGTLTDYDAARNYPLRTIEAANIGKGVAVIPGKATAQNEIKQAFDAVKQIQESELILPEHKKAIEKLYNKPSLDYKDLKQLEKTIGKSVKRLEGFCKLFGFN